MMTRNLALTLTLALAACGGSKSKTADTIPVNDKQGEDKAQVALPAIPSAPAQAPESLLAELSIGAPTQQLGKIASFMDAVTPGAGALMTPEQFVATLAGTIGAMQLGGVDLGQPVWALIHDEQTVKGSWVLVVGIADEAALRQSVNDAAGVEMVAHGGFAALGTVEALQAGAPYALSNLAATEPIDQVQLSVRMPRVLATHGANIQSVLAGMFQVSPASQSALMMLLGEVTMLKATLMVDHTAATMEFDAELADGMLKGFAASQKPATFELLKDVGMGPWAVVATGYLDLSAAGPVFAAVSGRAGPFAPLLGMVKDVKGEMAMGMKVTEDTPQLAMAVSVPDGKALAGMVDAVVDAMLAEQKKEGLRMDALDVKLKKNGIRGKSGNLHQLTFTVAKDVEKEKAEVLKGVYGGKGQQGFVGVVGDKVVATFGKDARKTAQRLSKGGADSGKNAALAAALEDSAKRGESLFVAVDIAAANQAREPAEGAPLAIGVSFQGGKASARVTMPVEQAREAQQGM